MKKIILVISTVALFILACNKSKTPLDNSSQSTQTNLSSVGISDEDKYDRIIETISYGLLDLSTNTAFQSIVNSEISKKFDEDDNVLLRSLNAECLEVGIDLKEEMKTTLLSHGLDEYIIYVDEAVDGFNYYGETLYPQIYIPFIEAQNLNSIPKICMNKDDDAILPIIEVQANTITSQEADEEFATVNLLWVISINESVNSLGELETSITHEVQKGTRNIGDRFLEVNAIKVHEKKEGWGNGRAEICHITRIYNPHTNSIDNQNQGEPFCKLANPDLDSWYIPTYMNGALKIVSNTPNFVNDDWEESKSEILKSLIYEKDRRKKFNKEEDLFPGVAFGKVYFCSKESIYGIVQPSFTDFAQIGASSVKEYNLGNSNLFKFNGSKLQ
jgi:hypothetical protein